MGGVRKGFDVAAIDDRRVLALNSHLALKQVVDFVQTSLPTLVAVDSPRCCAPLGLTMREGERQLARAICGIRWTPDEQHVSTIDYYAWILQGLALFQALVARNIDVIGVFPTASWTRWQGRRGSQTRSSWSRRGLVDLGLDGVPARTNQAKRDAIAAAATARLHTLGLTETIGEIVVPKA